MYDFHSHILPKIDDGAKNVSESMAILKTAYLQGTDTILATPHYYCQDMTVSEFLEKRDAAFRLLTDELALSGMPHPRILLGAEVHLSYDLMQINDLNKLCIENTSFMLVELPFTGLSDNVQKWLFALIANQGIIPILAHIERYVCNQKDFAKVQNLLKMDIYTQANCNSFMQFRGRKYLHKLVRSGSIHLLGTDVHNLTSRGYYLKQVYEKLCRRYGKALVYALDNNAKLIIEGKRPKKEDNY